LRPCNAYPPLHYMTWFPVRSCCGVPHTLTSGIQVRYHIDTHRPAGVPIPQRRAPLPITTTGHNSVCLMGLDFLNLPRIPTPVTATIPAVPCSAPALMVGPSTCGPRRRRSVLRRYASPFHRLIYSIPIALVYTLFCLTVFSSYMCGLGVVVGAAAGAGRLGGVAVGGPRRVLQT